MKHFPHILIHFLPQQPKERGRGYSLLRQGKGQHALKGDLTCLAKVIIWSVAKMGLELEIFQIWIPNGEAPSQPYPMASPLPRQHPFWLEAWAYILGCRVPSSMSSTSPPHGHTDGRGRNSSAGGVSDQAGKRTKERGGRGGDG